MSTVSIGDSVFLSVFLTGGETNLYPKAEVFDQNNQPVYGSPFTLSWVAEGYYVNNNNYAARITDQKLSVIYSVYEDAAHTVPSVIYSPSQEVIDVISSPNVSQIYSEVVSGAELVGTLMNDEVLSGPPLT